MDRHESLAKNTSEMRETIQPTKISETTEQKIATGYNGVLELLLMGMVTVAGFRLLYRKSGLYLDKARPLKPNIIKRLAQPNCKKCRFFDLNSNPKCTVHPLRISNFEAKNCPDYWQRDRRKFLHR